MTWRFIRSATVHGDKWDLPETAPVPLAQTGEKQRYMRRVGSRLEVSVD